MDSATTGELVDKLNETTMFRYLGKKQLRTLQNL